MHYGDIQNNFITPKEVTLLILAWLFGLLGPVIVDAIKKRYSQKEIRIAIFNELGSAGTRLVATVYQIESHLGTRTRQTLEWALSWHKKHESLLVHSEMRTTLEKLLRRSDAELAAVAATMRAAPERTLGVKSINLPFLESHLASLSLFSTIFQAHIMEIKTKIGLINEEVDQVKFYFNKSFEGNVSEQNRAIMNSNTEQCYLNITKQGRLIVDLIDSLCEKGD